MKSLPQFITTFSKYANILHIITYVFVLFLIVQVETPPSASPTTTTTPELESEEDPTEILPDTEIPNEVCFNILNYVIHSNHEISQGGRGV